MKKIDELKAEIEKRELELAEKKKQLEQFESIISLKIGDYVEYYTEEKGRVVGKLLEIKYNIVECVLSVKYAGSLIIKGELPKKWQPKKGDLCIFWDKNKKFAHISIFDNHSGGKTFPFESHFNCFRNCIPFISEQQFKEHIGYEEC